VKSTLKYRYQNKIKRFKNNLILISVYISRVYFIILVTLKYKESPGDDAEASKLVGV
jgi:hypothetical protein